MAAYHVEHLHSADALNNAIDLEGEDGSHRLAVVRFDAAMAAAAQRVGPIEALIAVDIEEVQDFNAMYDLHHKPCSVIFFYRYSDDNDINSNNWAAIDGADEFVDVVRVVHERATAGCRVVDFGY